jgi:hypothetical protein
VPPTAAAAVTAMPAWRKSRRVASSAGVSVMAGLRERVGDEKLRIPRRDVLGMQKLDRGRREVYGASRAIDGTGEAIPAC